MGYDEIQFHYKWKEIVQEDKIEWNTRQTSKLCLKVIKLILGISDRLRKYIVTFIVRLIIVEKFEAKGENSNDEGRNRKSYLLTKA